MTDLTKTRYLKVHPRGFANEFLVFRVPAADVDEATAVFDGYEDAPDRGGYTNWVSAPADPLDAVDWTDRRMLGY